MGGENSLKRKSRIPWIVSVSLALWLLGIGQAAYGYWTDRLNSSGTATMRQKATISVQKPADPTPEPSAGPTPDPAGNPSPEKEVRQLPDSIPDGEQPSAKPAENPDPTQDSKQEVPNIPDQGLEKRGSDISPQNTDLPQGIPLPDALRDSSSDKGNGNSSYPSKTQERKLP
jgi:hypothetical protein